MRLLSLNITFLGGIHYGFGSAIYDVARDAEEKKGARYQIMYAFLPGIMAFGSTNLMLFAAPLTLKEVTMGFTALMLTQTVGIKFD